MTTQPVNPNVPAQELAASSYYERRYLRSQWERWEPAARIYAQRTGQSIEMLRERYMKWRLWLREQGVRPFKIEEHGLDDPRLSDQELYGRALSHLARVRLAAQRREAPQP